MFGKLLILFSCLCLGALNGKQPLVVGTNAEFPPFSFIENKEIVGFDIDVAKEVARRLERPIQFKDVPFDALIPDLVLGRVDFVAAGMSATPERAKRVLFTKPYLTEDHLVILSSKQPLKLADLQGKNVVVVEGFTADLFMSTQPGIELIRLPIQADGFMAIKNNRADAFVTAKNTLNVFLETQENANFHMTEVEGGGDNCALALPKNRGELLSQIQEVLDGMEDDGTMAQLKAKWKLL